MTTGSPSAWYRRAIRSAAALLDRYVSRAVPGGDCGPTTPSVAGSMAPKVDTYTVRPTPKLRAAASTSSVPRTLVPLVSAWERLSKEYTDAAWTTASTPRTAPATAVPSVTSPAATSTAPAGTDSGNSAGATRSGSRARMRTRCPAAVSAATVCAPTNPVPPVTSTSIADLLSARARARMTGGSILPRRGVAGFSERAVVEGASPQLRGQLGSGYAACRFGTMGTLVESAPDEWEQQVAGTIRALRRRMFTPNVSEVRVSTRGFHDKGAPARTVLETVGTSFLTGLSSSAAARRVPDVAAA